MTFYIPMVWRCPDCGNTIEHSRSVPGSTVISTTGTPFCPFCFDAFLRKNIPLMEQTGERGEAYRR